MTGNSETTDAAENGAGEPADWESVPRPGPALRSAVVEYEGRADRKTVYPPTATDAELVTTWLSADATAFVSLAEMR